MDISFTTFTEADIPEMTRVMTRAFDDDSQKHLGKEKGGPPGYDDGEFFRHWLFGHKETDGYIVTADGKSAGGAIVWIFPHGHNVVGTIFIDPDFQDRGVGSALWKFIEEKYPLTKSWRLTTPEFAKKNHYFYETKCGFRRVSSDRIIRRRPAGEFLYRKQLKPGAGY